MEVNMLRVSLNRKTLACFSGANLLSAQWVFIGVLTLISTSLSFAGEIFDDFEDGDAKGWERSPQNKDSKTFWGVKKGEVIFDPRGSRGTKRSPSSILPART